MSYHHIRTDMIFWQAVHGLRVLEYFLTNLIHIASHFYVLPVPASDLEHSETLYKLESTWFH